MSHLPTIQKRLKLKIEDIEKKKELGSMLIFSECIQFSKTT